VGGQFDAAVGDAHPSLTRLVDFQHIDLTHELGDELVLRLIINLVGRADLHQTALAHYADAVAHHHRLFQAVGDVDEGLAGYPVDVLQLLFQRLAQPEIERRQRLVEEQYFRVEGQGAGQRHALPLAAGTLVHALVVIGQRQVKLFQQFLGPLAPRRLVDATDFQRKFHIFAHRAVREKRQRLEHHAGGTVVRRHVVDALAAQQDIAAGWLVHAGQHPDHRRLAAPGRPDDGEQLTFDDIQAKIVDGGEVTEFLDDVLQFQDRAVCSAVHLRFRRGAGEMGRTAPPTMPSKACGGASRINL